LTYWGFFGIEIVLLGTFAFGAGVFGLQTQSPCGVVTLTQKLVLPLGKVHCLLPLVLHVPSVSFL
jgi:hypothetical protein